MAAWPLLKSDVEASFSACLMMRMRLTELGSSASGAFVSMCSV